MALGNLPPTDFTEPLRAWLDSVKDDGTHVDSGGGMGARDFWVTVDGVEYFISVTRKTRPA